MRPSLKAITMPVNAILHNVATMNLTQVIYLPEDDAATTGGTDEIILTDPLQLFLR